MIDEVKKEWLKIKKSLVTGYELVPLMEQSDSLALLKALIDEGKLYDANWLMPRVMDCKQRLAYSIYAAEQVIDIFEQAHPDDGRPRKAIEASKELLKKDTHENRKAATSTAYFAAACSATTNAAAYAAARAAMAAYPAFYVVEQAADAGRYAAAASKGKEDMLLKILNYGIKILEDVE